MKDRVSCVVRRAVFAAAVVAFGFGSAWAGTFTWTGAGEDANWSTAENWSPNGVPGMKDDVVFDGTATNPDATIDADFQGQVYNLTLKADYSGTITQARVFKVNCDYVQLGGTFDCATYDFIVGAGDLVIDGLTTTGARDGTFQYHGGTFRNPRGGGLFRYVPRFISGGAKFAVGGENFIQYDDSNLLFGHGCSGLSASFYATNKVFKTIDFGFSTTFYGTNNVMQGTFAHSSGWLKAGTEMWQRTGVASFVVLGDVVVTNAANGGNLPLVFGTGEDQHVRFGPETNAKAANRVDRKPRSCGFLINKPAGKKVIVTTDSGGVAHFGMGVGSGAACTYGFKVDSGILDMSQAGTFTMGCESTTIDCARGEGTDILWPENAVFLVRSCTLKADYVFNNLEVDMQKGSRLIVPNGQTNVVNGSVTFTGSRIGGSVDGFYGRDTAYLEVHGDLYADGAVNANGGSSSGGSVNLLLNDQTHDQTLHFKTNGYLPNVIVDKPANLKVVCDCEPGVPMGFSAGANNASGGYLQINSGTVVAPTNGIRFYKCLYGGLVQNGGKLDMNGGPVVFSEREATEGSYNLLKAKDELNDLTIDIQPTRADGGWRGYGVSVPANTTNVVNGTFTFNRGRFVCSNAGTSLTDLRGDFRITSPQAVGGNCPLRFSGTNDQCYAVGEGCTNLYSTITVAKTGGRLRLGSDVDLTCSRSGPDVMDVHYSRALNLVSGTLDSNGHRLLLPTGTATVSDGFTFALPPVAAAEAPFATVGTLSLPAAGTVGVRVDVPKGESAETANPVRLWRYGKLSGFAPARWSVVRTERVGGGRVYDETDASTLWVRWRRRAGLALLLR